MPAAGGSSSLRGPHSGGGGDESPSQTDSSCSEAGSTTLPTTNSAFHTTPPHPGPSSHDYPSPNISVGPPIHPPPHLLPYLYPHSLAAAAAAAASYPANTGFLPGAAPHLSLLTHNPSLLFNAQLALAAQHPLFHNPYHPTTMHLPKTTHHRFTPYPIPQLANHHSNSAFDTVAPRSLSNSPGMKSSATVSPATSPPLASTTSKISTSSTPEPPTISTPDTITTPTTAITTTPTTASTIDSTKTKTITTSSPTHTTPSRNGNSLTELKSIEKMVNGLEMKTTSTTIAPTVVTTSKTDDEK